LDIPFESRIEWASHDNSDDNSDGNSDGKDAKHPGGGVERKGPERRPSLASFWMTPPPLPVQKQLFSEKVQKKGFDWPSRFC
jgi:hypothetical protein